MHTTYEKFDACYGVITGKNSSGSYLTLDNGEPAFCRHFSNAKSGTKVLCSVVKGPQDHLRTLVIIESVCDSCYAA